MTTEEKLIHFQEDAMFTARNKSSSELDSFSQNLEAMYDEHCRNARIVAENQLKLAKEALHREHNRELSKKQLETKRKLALTKDAITEDLFTRVLEMIAKYKETPEYTEDLLSSINEAKKTAGDQNLVVFIDETDSALKKTLAEKSGLTVKISKENILGGIEAVIPERSILIDLSFAQRLLEAKKNLKLGGE